MLNSFVRGTLAALAIGIGTAGLAASPAAAQGVRVIIDDGIRGEPVQYRDDYGRRDDFRGPPRDFDRRGDFRRGPPDFCGPRLALRKAYDIGLNRPRIVRESPRSVVVEGFRRGRIATVRFANDRGCPVLDVRR